MKARALVNDDKRMLKLPCALGVEPEVRLKRDGHLHALGHVHKRAAGPHRAVERGKLMVARGDELHKILLNHVGVLAFKGALHVGIDDALRSDLVADIVIDKLRVILRADAGERLALCLRDAKALKRVLYILGHVVPVVLHFCVRADISGDMVNVQSLYGRTPIGGGGLVIYLQGMKPELLHPDGIVLFLGQLVDYPGRQPLLHAVGIMFNVTDVIYAAVYILNAALLSHGVHRPFIRPSRRQSRAHLSHQRGMHRRF